MNETKWLTGTDGDAMLEVVSDRLSPRQWLLVCCAYARRLWDFLPAGVLQQAIDFAERAEKPLTPSERTAWQKKIDAAVPEAVGAAEQAQRAIVKSALAIAISTLRTMDANNGNPFIMSRSSSSPPGEAAKRSSA